MLDIDSLLEHDYKTDTPWSLDIYFMDIEWESSSSEAWSGKIWQQREDGGYFPMCAVENTGTGAQNNYYPIVFNEFPLFKKVAKKCFPKALDPLDYACMYLELREAKREQDLDNDPPLS